MTLTNAMALRLNSIRACRCLVLLLFMLLYAHVSYCDERKEDIYGSGNYGVYLHGDTLSWLVCSGHFHDAQVMHTALSFPITVENDTIIGTNQPRSQFSPITVYSAFADIDEFEAINTTSDSYRLLRIFCNAYLFDDNCKHEGLSTIDILGYPRTIELNNRTRIYDLCLYISGLAFPLKNYFQHVDNILPQKEDYPQKALVFYNASDIIRSLKFRLSGGILTIYDWLGNRLAEFMRFEHPIMLFEKNL